MEIRTTLFNITECGYYERGAEEAQFGDIDTILNDLASWSDGCEISDTKLTDTDEEKGVFPIYLLDIKKTLDGWAIACWNAVPTSDGKVGAIKLDTKVGEEPDISWSTFDPESIPGFPSYYWINTKLNITCTITPKGWSNSIKSLERYIKDFMKSFSKFTLLDENNAVTGYSETDEEEMHLYPRFKMHLLKRSDEVKFIIDHASEITKVWKKGMLHQANIVDSGLMIGLLRWLKGKASKEVMHKDAHINVEVSYRPTKKEVEAMIEEEDANQDGARTDDIGFFFPAQNDYIWVNKSRASDTFDVLAKFNKQGILSIESIDSIIRENGRKFLALRERENERKP